MALLFSKWPDWSPVGRLLWTCRISQVSGIVLEGCISQLLDYCVFRLLLAKNKSLIDIADPEGRTALHWATKPESHKVLEFLSQNCGSEIGEQDGIYRCCNIHSLLWTSKLPG